MNSHLHLVNEVSTLSSHPLPPLPSLRVSMRHWSAWSTTLNYIDQLLSLHPTQLMDYSSHTQLHFPHSTTLPTLNYFDHSSFYAINVVHSLIPEMNSECQVINELIKMNSECWGINKMHCYYLTLNDLFKWLHKIFLTKSQSMLWQENLLCAIPVAPSGWLYWGLTCKPDHTRRSSHIHTRDWRHKTW